MATQTIKNPFLEASFNMNSYANSMLCYIYIVRLLNRDQIIKKIFQKINAVNLQNRTTNITQYMYVIYLLK